VSALLSVATHRVAALAACGEIPTDVCYVSVPNNVVEVAGYMASAVLFLLSAILGAVIFRASR
jgi:hypothetical protein